MQYQNLREFIAALESERELIRINKEIDWHLEMGAISRRAIDLCAPAPLFEKVKDYAEGFRVLGSYFGPTRPITQGRLALAMGLPKNTSPLEDFI